MAPDGDDQSLGDRRRGRQRGEDQPVFGVRRPAEKAEQGRSNSGCDRRDEVRPRAAAELGPQRGRALWPDPPQSD
jgi:hypothetical protein